MESVATPAGPLHVGYQMRRRLQLDAILKAVNPAAPARQLTDVMTLNRLVHPCSELAMMEWAKRAAGADLLGSSGLGQCRCRRSAPSTRSTWAPMRRLWKGRARVRLATASVTGRVPSRSPNRSRM